MCGSVVRGFPPFILSVGVEISVVEGFPLEDKFPLFLPGEFLSVDKVVQVVQLFLELLVSDKVLPCLVPLYYNPSKGSVVGFNTL